MHFHDTYASLTITIVEDHKRARINVEYGVQLSLEAIRIAEEEEEHTHLEAEEEAWIVE